MIINIGDNLKCCGIYKINYDNGKIYIGQSLSVYKRALEHNSKNKMLCDKALKVHKAEIEILEKVEDISLLDKKESYWINFYHSNNKNLGYNILTEGNVSIKKGTSHPNAKISDAQLKEIINLLKNDLSKTQIDIADLYKVSPATIRNINNGRTYIDPNLIYPIRNGNQKEYLKKETLEDYNLTEEIIYNLKNDLFFRWDLTMERELIAKYNLPVRLMRDINQGRKYQEINNNFNYPIRKNSISNPQNFTQQDIQNILNLLRNTKLSMTKIGEMYNLHRNTISKINKGESFPIQNYNYPARD